MIAAGALAALVSCGAGPATAAPADEPSRQTQCLVAALAVERVLDMHKGMKLAYALDLPEVTVTERSWTRRMSLPLLAQFDATSHASAVSICPNLQTGLEERGATRVEDNSRDDQWGVRKRDRIAVVRVTLPVLSADGKGAMVRAEVRCGHGCGGGDTFYFTRLESGWTQTAIRAEWMGSVYISD